MSYCSNPSSGQGQMPGDFWTKVNYEKGNGKNGKPYVQRKLKHQSPSGGIGFLTKYCIFPNSDRLHQPEHP